MDELKNNVLEKSTESVELRHLFDVYYLRLCYFAHKIIDNKEESEDIVQDAFATFWKKNAEFDNENSARNYLYLSVKNACFNNLRHKKVAMRYVESQPTSELEEEKISHNIIRAELLGQIHLAISSLPKGCAQVLTLAFFDELKNNEIAELLGISINTVKTQKARALQLLRMKLDIGALLLVLAAPNIL